MFCLITALVVYTRGIIETVIFFTSILLHEAFHILISACFGFEIKSFGIGAFGFKFGCEALPPSGLRGSLIYLAGPLANLSLAFLTGFINYYAEMPMSQFIIFYNLILFAVNMIPAYPMDAARALTSALSKYMGNLKAVRIVSTLSYMISALLFTAGVIAALTNGNLVLAMLSVVIALNTKKEKSFSVMNYLKNIKI